MAFFYIFYMDSLLLVDFTKKKLNQLFSGDVFKKAETQSLSSNFKKSVKRAVVLLYEESTN